MVKLLVITGTMAFKQMGMITRKLYLNFSQNVSTKSKISKEIGIGGFALLSIPLTTFCLGTWQVKRRAWKLNLIEEVKTKNKAPPVELPKDFETLSSMEYQRVHVRGKFEHSKELYIGPRQPITGSEGDGGIFSSRPQSGYLVVTPFHITDKDMTVLVNRGWVPKNKVDPSKRSEGQVSEEIELVGTVRLPEKRPQFSPKSQPNSKNFFYRDVPKMVEMTGAAPIFIDADANSTVSGGPIGGQTRITFRNEHMSYILTWYSLSIATSYMWYRKYFYRVKTV
ncbi:surfeit locus protein 1 [Trichonephila clavata]|uniref:SURF1-like protein n=1 Tax=Trichonephila clavata TaxID=2740835 RepID=A0A8X6LL99_TRICU|nr:surfeit locus protein 1 [Trichonephila clavata]